MIAYIKSCQRYAEAEKAREKAAANMAHLVEVEAARERLSPLDDRLARLLATIPTELQREGLSLAILQAGLRGRWRGHCHPGDLGNALRRLGFNRRRQWADDVGFRALWFPASRN